MALRKISDEALRELQDALGEENASADPGLLQVYSFMNSLESAIVGLWWLSPMAVCLPSNMDEIKKVIEICKKHNLRIKPHAAAWGFWALACNSEVVILDLRRMDNLVDINERDGYVVIEPYCTSGEQQVELMKRGLNSHTNGAGPNACILSSATNLQGSGGTSMSMSNSERNCLGCELITTDGDVVYFGSPGTPNAGFFTGDGPGPSMRGAMRGAIGNFGGQAVYTKAAAKCYPWYNPPFEVNAPAPFFKSTEIPNYEIRTVRWDTYDIECDALYRIGEAEICDYCARLGAGAYEAVVSTTNEEYCSIKESQIFPNCFPKGAWTLTIAASCKEELDARLKVLEHIVEDTDGIMVDVRDFGTDAYEAMVQTTIRGCYIFKAAFMPAGAMGCFFPMSYETIDNMWKVNIHENDIIKKELQAHEMIADDGYDNNYCSLDEHGHFGHIESPWQTDFWEPKEQNLTGMILGVMSGVRKHIPIIYSPMTVNPPDLVRYVIYMSKVQKVMDPADAMDSIFGNVWAIMKGMDDIDELETIGEKVMVR